MTVDNNQRLGVGTSSPSTKLHVANGPLVADNILRASTSSVSIDANQGGTAAAPALVVVGDTDTGWYRPASNTIGFSTAGSERLRIDSSGRVGIGTSSPTLSAGTGLHLRDSNTGIRLNPSSDGGQGYIEFADESNTVQYISGYRDANTSYNICPGSNLSIASGLHIDTSGNVGIGTTSPAAKLNVYTAEGRDFRIDQLAANTTTLSNDRTLALESGSSYPIHVRGKGSSSSVRLSTNSIERARIDSSGRLLVGTTTPSGYSDRLATFASTAGTTVEIRSGTTAYGQLAFSDSTAADSNSYAGFVRYDHDTNAMRLGANGADRFQIGANGQFGIGGATYGTSGQVLTSQGSGSAPQWATPAAGGKVLQVVHKQIATIPTSNSQTWADISGFNISITPTSSTSKILLTLNFGRYSSNTAQVGGAIRLLRGSTVINVGNAGGSSRPEATFICGSQHQNYHNTQGIMVQDSPGTTSAVTYKLQWLITHSTAYYHTLNSGTGSYDLNQFQSYYARTVSTLTAMEISA